MIWHGIRDTDGDRVELEPNGSLPVTLQDQTTPVLIAPLHQKTNTTALSVITAVDDYSMTIDSTTGFIDDTFIGLSCPDCNEVWFGRQVGAPVGNVISFDRPMDYAFTVGSVVTANITNMNVNGSVTPQIFSLRDGIDPGVNLTADVVRIMFLMTTDTGVDLLKFGDIAELTMGVTLRHVDGEYHSIVTIKSNGELAGIAYDLEMYASTNPQQGSDGLTARLTFGGQSKMGVVVRVSPDEDLQCIINDDLTDLARFVIIAEGSVAIT